MKTKLLDYAWGQAILYTASLIRIKLIDYNKYSPLQLTFGQPSNCFHLRTFCCAIYILIASPKHNKMGSQHRPRIYIGFDFPIITNCLEPLTIDIFKAHFEYCHFDETVFSPLKGEKLLEVQK